ncbi:MAG: lipase family protein [Bacteroidetes bacterium]|nr:lipase family protein [Bacteroidota bacterium]
MYHPLVYHLDLCTLSYHLYAQTLVWPFDPYYEMVAHKGSSRRITFMNFVRPTLPTFQPHLDPINFDYTLIDPHQIAVNRVSKNTWHIFEPQPEIINDLDNVYIQGANQNIVRTLTPNQGNQSIDLYVFLGETGNTESNATGNLSMMGIVLHRKLQNAPDTIHIVFRGSRSGKSERSIYERMGRGGNPDWVTDLQFDELRPEADICSCDGARVSIGFAYSIRNTWPYLASILNLIHANTGAKQKIYITGHSLAGALATHFISGIRLGTLLQNHQNLQSWGWEDAKLITYGAPPAGNVSFAHAINSSIFSRRIYLDKDPITFTHKIKPSNSLEHAGVDIKLLHDLDQHGFFNHKLSSIRWSLLKGLKKWGLLNNLQNQIPGVINGNPQQGYHSFWHERSKYDDVRQLIQTFTPAQINMYRHYPVVNLVNYKNHFARTMGDNRAYFISKKTQNLNQRTVDINAIAIPQAGNNWIINFNGVPAWIRSNDTMDVLKNLEDWYNLF